jgi:hypothetical protein
MRRGAAAASALALAVGVAALSRAGQGPAEESPPPIALALPLPADLPATASFGEFRAGHLHAGLDFSTRGEIGWPVHAAADGEIYRLKVEARGYGRALYLRHADGYETVYGHLLEFDQGLGLERFVAAERARRGERFPGDLQVDPPIRVVKGQVIALSGERGGGLPHLHFELRHRGDPVDPIRYGGIMPAGFGDVQPTALRLIPRGPLRVNGAWGAAMLPLVGSQGRYSLDGVPVVEGEFDLEVEAGVAGSGRMGVSRLDLQCDGAELYRLDLHRFSFLQYRESGLVLDAASSRSSPARYAYRLRALPGLDLPGVEGEGIAALDAPGRRRCTLALENERGGRSLLRFGLEVRAAPPYSGAVPASARSWSLFDRLLLLDGRVALDPAGLVRAGDILPTILLPADPERVVDLAGGASVTLPREAFYGPTPVAIGPVSGGPPTGLDPVVPPFRIGPDDLFLRESAILRVPAADPTRTAFYWRDPADDHWECLGKEVREGAAMSGTRGGGTFAAFRDAVAPRITGAQVRAEPRAARRRLVLAVTEIGEGVDVDGCQVSIDGAAAEAEYDPDREWAEVWLSSGASGKHRVRSTCRDRAGNTSQVFTAQVEFTAKKGRR